MSSVLRRLDEQFGGKKQFLLRCSLAAHDLDELCARLGPYPPAPGGSQQSCASSEFALPQLTNWVGHQRSGMRSSVAPQVQAGRAAQGV